MKKVEKKLHLDHRGTESSGMGRTSTSRNEAEDEVRKELLINVFKM